MKSAFIGKWRVIGMEQLDQDFVDLVSPGHITFKKDGMHVSPRLFHLLQDIAVRPFIPAYVRAVPQRLCRKRSNGEKRILSASRPMKTITIMMPRTASMAWSSRP
jgi:hypothetical protein